MGLKTPPLSSLPENWFMGDWAHETHVLKRNPLANLCRNIPDAWVAEWRTSRQGLQRSQQLAELHPLTRVVKLPMKGHNVIIFEGNVRPRYSGHRSWTEHFVNLPHPNITEPTFVFVITSNPQFCKQILRRRVKK